MPDPTRPALVAHVITWLDVGGAQENTLYCCLGADQSRFPTVLVTGTRRGDPGYLYEEARSAGLDVVLVRSLRQEVAPLHEAIGLVQLVRLFRRIKPSIVHTHSSKAGVIGRIAAWLSGARVVHTVHGWSFHERQSPLVRNITIRLERLLARITDVIAVQSGLDEQKGRGAGIGREAQYCVVRSGVDLDKFGSTADRRAAARGALGVASEAPLVGSVTRLSMQKDPETLLRAFAVVLRSLPGAKLVVIGDGPLQARVQHLAVQLGVSDGVLWLGNRRDVAELLPGFDVMALSSRWEGLPRAIPEAMASGVPVVATAVDGVPEIVRHGLTGLLVPPGEPSALGTAILSLLENPRLARRLAVEAEAVVPQWGVTEMVRGFDAVYRRVLGSSERD